MSTASACRQATGTQQPGGQVLGSKVLREQALRWRGGPGRLSGFGLLILCLIATMAGGPAAQAAELLMFTRASCPYCVLWERQIGPIYPKTEEAERAPLRRIDLDKAGAEMPVLASPVTITPTFVIMDGGREIGRFSGYGDELTFWSALSVYLARLPARPTPAVEPKTTP